MKLSKIFLTILIFFTFTTKLYAADYTITCTNKTCQTNDTTIFNQTNLAPQDSFSKTVEIKNIHSKNIDISLHPISTSSATIIEKIDITVNNSSSSLYFNNSLKEFLNSTINLKNIGGKSSQTFTISASMQRMDNSFQGKEVKFDLRFDFSQPERSSAGTSNNQTAATFYPSEIKKIIEKYLGNNFSDIPEVLGESTPPINPPNSFIKTIKEYLRWWPWLLLLIPFIYWILLLYKRRRVR